MFAKRIKIILSTIIISAATISPSFCESNKEKFINEVNTIRALQGSGPLETSAFLQEKTQEYSEVIQKEECDIIQDNRFSISSLSRVSSVINKCTGGLCKLTPIQVEKQSVSDEAWSLAYRSNQIYSPSSTHIAVSFAICGDKTVVIVSTK